MSAVAARLRAPEVRVVGLMLLGLVVVAGVAVYKLGLPHDTLLSVAGTFLYLWVFWILRCWARRARHCGGSRCSRPSRIICGGSSARSRLSVLWLAPAWASSWPRIAGTSVGRGRLPEEASRFGAATDTKPRCTARCDRGSIDSESFAGGSARRYGALGRAAGVDGAGGP
jgi:hypothetical protein